VPVLAPRRHHHVPRDLGDVAHVRPHFGVGRQRHRTGAVRAMAVGAPPREDRRDVGPIRERRARPGLRGGRNETADGLRLAHRHGLPCGDFRRGKAEVEAPDHRRAFVAARVALEDASAIAEAARRVDHQRRRHARDAERPRGGAVGIQAQRQRRRALVDEARDRRGILVVRVHEPDDDALRREVAREGDDLRQRRPRDGARGVEPHERQGARSRRRVVDGARAVAQPQVRDRVVDRAAALRARRGGTRRGAQERA
jgi:hypothetical protein